MGILTEEMQRVVREQRLGFVATVNSDGTPNLSPKGTVTVWDDDHLVFADIASPGTMENLRWNKVVEINVVDPLVRKGWRFRGTARVVAGGPRLDRIIEFYRELGVTNPIRSAVMVKIERALPVTSPVYDQGLTEDQVRGRWEAYQAFLRSGQGGGPLGA